jgi:predicted RNA-binding protein YlqC (UPF0109 family)
MEEYKEVEYLKTIVKGILKKEFSVERTVDDLGILLSLKVSSEDIPTIIGKEGNTAKSIRSLVRIFGYNIEKKISVKIEIPEKDFIKK